MTQGFTRLKVPLQYPVPIAMSEYARVEIWNILKNVCIIIEHHRSSHALQLVALSILYSITMPSQMA